MADNYQPAGQPPRRDYAPSSGPKPKVPFADQSKPLSQNTRAEAVQGERRRRRDTGPMSGLKLYVPEEDKDPNYVYRWFTGDPGRLHAKTVMDDWDLVDVSSVPNAPPEQQAEGGTRVARFAEKGATGPGGQPRKMFLARKLKSLYQADKAAEQEAIKAKEDAIKRGPTKSPEGNGLRPEVAYVPNSLSERSYSDGPGQNRIVKE